MSIYTTGILQEEEERSDEIWLFDSLATLG